MTLGDDLAAALPDLRAAARSRMRATCTIRRVASVSTDATTGAPTVTWVAPDPYVGACRTRYPGLAHEQTPEVGGATVVASRLIVHIPHGTQILPGDRVRIDSDPDNPIMVNAVLRVASVDDQSQATAQRLLCEDYQAGVLG